jgi:hypothetical protein
VQLAGSVEALQLCDGAQFDTVKSCIHTLVSRNNVKNFFSFTPTCNFFTQGNMFTILSCLPTKVRYPSSEQSDRQMVSSHLSNELFISNSFPYTVHSSGQEISALDKAVFESCLALYPVKIMPEITVFKLQLYPKTALSRSVCNYTRRKI